MEKNIQFPNLETQGEDELKRIDSLLSSVWQRYCLLIDSCVTGRYGKMPDFDEVKLEEILTKSEEEIIGLVVNDFGENDIALTRAYGIIRQIYQKTIALVMYGNDARFNVIATDEIRTNAENYQRKAIEIIKRVWQMNLTKSHDPTSRYKHYDKLNYASDTLWSSGIECISYFCYDYPKEARSSLDTKGLVDCLIERSLLDDSDFDSDFSGRKTGEIAEILSLNPEYSAGKLLGVLQNTRDPKLKERSSDLLCHIEFGEIGVSKNGVRYLGAQYDLSEEDLNDTDYSAQRLTAKGDIGIFNVKHVLIKYFNLGELGGEGKIIKPEVLDFVYKTLFFTKENETADEREQREKYLEEFKRNYFGFYNNEFFFRTKVRFNNLNFREQGWFLIFYKNANQDKKDHLIEFVEKFREDGLKSFLSLEFGHDLGDRILEIGANLEKSHAPKIFGKIAELADLTNEEEKEFQKLLTKEDANLSGIQLEFLKKAHQIILNFSGSEKDIDKLLKDLDQSKIEITTLSAIFKTFKEQGKSITFEDIRDLELSYVESATKLSKEEIEEMITTADINWNQIPTMKEAVISGLRADLESEKYQKIYILRYQGKIASFIRFEETEHGTIYAGSFNVKTELRGVDVGNEMIERTLIKESQEQKDGKYPIIEGTVSPRIPVGTNYIEQVGFVIDGMIASYHETGEPLFTLELDNNKNPGYTFRNEGKEEKITMRYLIDQYREYSEIGELIGSDSIVLRYDMKTDWGKMMNELPKLLTAKDSNLNDLPDQSTEPKYKITRYFRDKEQLDRDIRYFVLEKIAA